MQPFSLDVCNPSGVPKRVMQNRCPGIKHPANGLVQSERSRIGTAVEHLKHALGETVKQALDRLDPDFREDSRRIDFQSAEARTHGGSEFQIVLS